MTTTMMQPEKEIVSSDYADHEMSYYALEIGSISELFTSSVLNETQSKAVYTLRVMHCNNLSSLSGIELFSNLTELNCSSNQITRIDNLFGLTKLTTLNLSGNAISSIPDLSSLSSLEVLILSHNRISDISGLSNVRIE